MADKSATEANLADAVHKAEYAVGQALAQPAGAGRIERISRAQDALIKAEAAYQDCLDGRGYDLKR
jgi:hypothetical protein